MLRASIHAIIGFLFRLLSRLDVKGLENIPATGAAILVANHLGRLDSPLLFCLVERSDVTSLVAEKYQNNLLLRPLVNALQGIWINRERADFGALRRALEHLESGGMLGVAPEGTRSKSGALMAAKTGAAYLADRAGVGVLPVGIWGSETAVAKLLRLQRPPIHVRFGRLFQLPPLERGEREAGLKRNTDEIMCQIAALLPENYWGVYAEQPRLKELLGSQMGLGIEG